MEFYAHTWGLSDSPTTAIKIELNRLGGFLSQTKHRRRGILTEPQETPFLGAFFHKRNQAATIYLMSTYQTYTCI